jgi:hypothetical protein
MVHRNVCRGILTIGTLAIAATMGACTTTPTPYQPYRAESAGGVHGGYTDQLLAPNRFRVRFHGNELTSRERVETYLLYRAAELTVANGYDWFAIADHHTEHDVETYVRQSPWGAYGYWQPLWRYHRYGYGWDVWYPGYGRPFWADTIDVTTVEAFEVEAEITLQRGSLPAGDPNALDARRIMSDLAQTIVRPKGG